MTRKKKIIVGLLTLISTYYLIGFPLTLFGVVKEWPLYPGISLQFGGQNTSVYENDSVTVENDGPYIFYKGDSVEVISFRKNNSSSVPVFHSYIKSDTSYRVVDVRFSDHEEWNFLTKVKNTLQIEQTVFHAPNRVLAISDIEGNFPAFREFLLSNNVVDSSYHWLFGQGHLVLLGDFFDRGTHVTECLWLIYDLEQKAEVAGGKVHFILGNHEIMNMTDDFRYVRKKYLTNSDTIGKSYREMFKQDSELGRWLSTKNIVEKIGNMVVTHGGISEEVFKLELSLDEINAKSRPYYFTPRKDIPQEDQIAKTLFSSAHSPLWNRDYVEGSVDEKLLEKVLNAYNSDKIIIGHTMVETVKLLYAGRVMAIDTDHTKENSQGLLIEGNNYYSVDRKGQKTAIK